MKLETKAQKWGVVAGALAATVTVSTAGWSGLVWAADQRYVTQESMQKIIHIQRLQSVGDNIDILELKVLYSEATNAEKARLEKLKREREELLKGNE